MAETGNMKSRGLVIEEVTMSDVRSTADSKIDDLLKSRQFRKKVREVAVEVLDDFFREMWRKKGFWQTGLKNGN